jgi:hypothetical protein
MTKTRHDDLEHSLRDLFDRQHRAVEPSDTTWDPSARVAIVDLDSQRTGARRRLGVATIAVTTAAATVGIGLAVVSLTGTDSSAGKTHPAIGSSGPTSTLPPGACSDGTTSETFPCSPSVHWNTPQVHLEGAQFSIITSGSTGVHDFVGDDPKMTLHSDPGDAKYQTLELEWHELGVAQRWYIYFASDGTDWWATEMRTYDGSPGGDWVYFGGERFRTPLGSAWSGNLDVTASDHGVASHLRMHITHLEAFLSHGPSLAGAGGAAATYARSN